MVGVETSSAANLNATDDIRGGWLASEVGMGKTAVVLALVQSNPAAVRPSKAVIQQQLLFPKPSHSSAILKLKATIVVTSVSLLGQWEEESKKHSPTLTVKRYHPNSKGDNTRLLNFSKATDMAKDLEAADVIITTATFSGHHDFQNKFEFYRVVVDESHLMGSSSMNRDCCYGIQAKRRWCVSATPFSKIRLQERFLKLAIQLPQSYNLSQKQSFYVKVDHYRKIMTRHAKDQRINGIQALALPPSTTSILHVTMNVRERRLYNSQWIDGIFQTRLSNFVNRGVQSFAFETQILIPLSMSILLKKAGVSMVQSTKVQAIVNDIRQMLANEPKGRVVIYSQYKDTADAVVAALRHIMKVHSFDGSTRADKRDQAIKEFQSMATPGAAAFVITLRAGSVGLTLTSASRMYLMEPCIDTAKELQAAGRIHRLGQTKNVEVKKLIYRNSIEENIQLLQTELIAGRIKLGMNGTYFPAEAIKILSNGRTGLDENGESSNPNI